METATQRCERIVSALEDLAAQEAAGVAQGDFAAVQALHERTAPLVEFLATAGSESLNAAGLRRRLVAIYELRHRSGEALAAAMARTRLELAQTQASQRRVARIAPAYGHQDFRAPHLHAVG
ncbi:MAG: hypothetical protein JNL92_09655 [Opitutaceae bacterium]|nr:hypothetical protein [Opitutaceae bacterium]